LIEEGGVEVAEEDRVGDLVMVFEKRDGGYVGKVRAVDGQTRFFGGGGLWGGGRR